MKKIIMILLLPVCGCSLNIHLDGGITNAGTMISDTNFRYEGKIKGEAKSFRILIFSHNNGNLYNRAMADIYNKADLYDDSKKGLINITYDFRYESNFLGLWGNEVCTITADVVEFIDKK